MWYFTWILGVGLALAFGIINVMWLEASYTFGELDESRIDERFARRGDLHLVVVVTDSHFEVRRGHGKPVITGGNLHAEQDGLGGPCRDNRTGYGQRFEQRPAIADYFHGEPFRIPLGLERAA